MIFENIFNKVYDKEVLSKIKFLSGISLFKGIKRKDLLYFLENMYENRYKSGDLVFEEGDIGRALFIVYKGSIGLYRKNNKNDIVYTVKSGEFLGEMALLEEMPRTFSAVALEDTYVFMFYKADLENIITSKPKIAARLNYNLARILSQRLRGYIKGEKSFTE